MPATLKGIFAMLAGMAFLIGGDAIAKHLVSTHPIAQVLCLRQAASLLFILPYAWHVTGLRALVPVNVKGQLLRGAILTISGGLIVWSLALLPLATVTAVTFSGPIFIALLAWPILGERVGGWLWAAILLGFAGVLLMVRPGSESVQWALLVPVAAALTAGLRDIMARLLARTETSIGILFWSTLVLVALTSLTAPFGWTALSAETAAWFVLAGAVNFSAHFLIIEAYRLGRAAVIAPFKYSGLLWAVILGYLFWGQLPDAAIWAGAAVLVASGLWIARLETRRPA